ncbi:uncharacterized protein LOC108117131 [Drosophila eugracilis]|uniref:uncharacterized protein LOC108117131 n=1 Tax=Drosophila eugracilis TaxID=29029 RepID=UPI001BD9C4ED|nr:uncharacterized protein LOC108117131 [Drosophila eugracilis]XP_017084865.2 uncharacterized protein LOC108117131 [Drosophila eugracilis]
MSHAVVNEETLEAMVYERSKVWSSLIKNVSTFDDGLDMLVSDFDDIFQGEDENSELKFEGEEAEEENVPEAKLEQGHINATSIAELTVILCPGEDNAGKAEIEEILNQTMPVVEKHKRKWREAGLERVLNTFDEKQIERHVGGWMRRHNGVYLETTPPKYLHPQDHSISDYSDESLHSIDTARYIQQSRQRNTHMNNKSSNMTTIKMYRKHSHKRDELRAKYAYDDEQEHRHHMQALLHRRREKERKLAYLASSPMRCIHSSSHHVRRKQLRKRRANSWMFDSASSSEDDPSLSGCDCHTCRRHALSKSAYQCCSHGSDQRDYHQAASMSMHTMRRHHNCDMQMNRRPKLSESDCSCCNSDRFCPNIVQVANSSTEQWLVQNRSSRKHKQQLMAVIKNSPEPVRYKCHDHRLPKRKAASASKLVKSKPKYEKISGSESSDEDNAFAKRALFSSSQRKRGNSVPTPRVSGKTTTARKVVRTKGLPQILEEGPRAIDMLKIYPSGRNKDLHTPKGESSTESEDGFISRSGLLSFVEKNQKTKEISTDVRATEKAIPKEDTLAQFHLPPINENVATKKTLVEKKNGLINPKTSHPPVENKSAFDIEAKSNYSIQIPEMEEKESASILKRATKIVKPIRGVKETITNPMIKENIQSLEGNNLAENDKRCAKKHIRVESESSDKSKEENDERKRIASSSLDKTKSKCSTARKGVKPTLINSSSSQVHKVITNTEVPEENSPILTFDSSASSASSVKTVASVERRRKISGKAKTIDKPPETEKSSGTPIVKNSKKKETSIEAPSLPEIREEDSSQSPDSQEKPEPNPSIKVPKKKHPGRPKKISPRVDEVPELDEDFQQAVALSLATFKEDQQKRRKTKKQGSKEQIQSPVEQSTVVFNNQSVTCNSTAVANDTASSRVLAKKLAVKRVAVVSTTEDQTATNSSSSPETARPMAGDLDCTVVTSTTCCEAPASDPMPPPPKLTKRGILLHSSSDQGAGNFTLTEQGLGKFIGDRLARKYLKYHIGSRSFDSRHSVYYQPTPELAAALSSPIDAQSLANISTSSASDDDIFDQVNRYGTIYSVLGKKSD